MSVQFVGLSIGDWNITDYAPFTKYYFFTSKTSTKLTGNGSYSDMTATIQSGNSWTADTQSKILLKGTRQGMKCGPSNSQIIFSGLSTTEYKYILCSSKDGSSMYKVNKATTTVTLNGGYYTIAGIVASTTDFTAQTFPCFIGSCKITMADKSLKEIKDIKRGDLILENKNTNKINMVAHVTVFTVLFDCNIIPPKLLENSEEIVCTEHPIWCNNGKNRIFPSKIEGVIQDKKIDTLYDIQYEYEGTFYVDNVLVDSLSPNYGPCKLKKELFFNPEKYTDHIMTSEDDEMRQKPPMTEKLINYLHY